MASLVYFLVHASQIFTYGSASDPPSPPHYSSTESVTPIGNSKPGGKPQNMVPNIPAVPDSDPSLSGSSFSDSSDSSDNEYYKRRRRAKNNKNKCRSKTHLDDPIKKVL